MRRTIVLVAAGLVLLGALAAPAERAWAAEHSEATGGCNLSELLAEHGIVWTAAEFDVELSPAACEQLRDLRVTRRVAGSTPDEFDPRRAVFHRPRPSEAPDERDDDSTDERQGERRTIVARADVEGDGAALRPVAGPRFGRHRGIAVRARAAVQGERARRREYAVDAPSSEDRLYTIELQREYLEMGCGDDETRPLECENSAYERELRRRQLELGEAR